MRPIVEHHPARNSLATRGLIEPEPDPGRVVALAGCAKFLRVGHGFATRRCGSHAGADAVQGLEAALLAGHQSGRVGAAACAQVILEGATAAAVALGVARPRAGDHPGGFAGSAFDKIALDGRGPSQDREIRRCADHDATRGGRVAEADMVSSHGSRAFRGRKARRLCPCDARRSRSGPFPDFPMCSSCHVQGRRPRHDHHRRAPAGKAWRQVGGLGGGRRGVVAPPGAGLTGSARDAVLRIRAPGLQGGCPGSRDELRA